jgi:hypothetical protein
MRTPNLLLLRLALTLVTLAVLTRPAHAQPGVVFIDQAAVDAGGITPGDAPGFPATLSVPGSYRLSGNLTVPDENTTAIEITNDNVTLDLGGFSILGPGKAGNGWGVLAVGRGNITVLNGTVRGMGDWGVVLSGNIHRVENLQALLNGGGISVGDGSRVTGCTVSLNAFDGIDASSGSSVVGNVARSNGRSGLGLVGAGNGYAQNVLTGNGVNISGGVNMGHNVCGTALCP